VSRSAARIVLQPRSRAGIGAAGPTEGALLARFAARRARVGVMGLGYVGLPLACTFAEAGFSVIGFDTDPAKVAALAAGRSYIRHLPAARVRALHAPIDALVRDPPAARGMAATTDVGRLAARDAVLVCVPTPLTATREPDLSHVIRSTEAVARALRRGQLVVLESTTYPGTTDEVVRPLLDTRNLTRSVRAGRDRIVGA